MSRRIVLGPRANGDVGLFIAPPGLDAMTAGDAFLILNVTSKVSQLVLVGRIPASATIPLGLGRSPYVFITSQFDFSGVPGHTTGPGPLRPSPPPGGTASTATINSNGVSMTITTIYPTVYQVYNQAFT
jgi:hypothetical protein